MFLCSMPLHSKWRKRRHFLFPFSLFEMHGGRSMVYSAFVVVWPYKHNGICFSVQSRFIANKESEAFPFSLFEMHGGRSMVYSVFSVFFWPQKHNGIYFSVWSRFIANKEEWGVSFFLIPYSKCMVYSAFVVFWLQGIIVYIFLSNAVS